MDASISTDNGTTWQTIDFGSLSQASIYGADAAVNGSIALCTNTNFILLSNDCGKTWEEITDGLTTYATCVKCTVKGDSLLIFAGTPIGLMRLNYPLVNLGLPSLTGYCCLQKVRVKPWNFDVLNFYSSSSQRSERSASQAATSGNTLSRAISPSTRPP